MTQSPQENKSLVL